MNMEVPRYGPRTLEPAISYTITTAPQTKTTISRKYRFIALHIDV
jgi:hypothetical protein